jgi:hypothetical protein
MPGLGLVSAQGSELTSGRFDPGAHPEVMRVVPDSLRSSIEEALKDAGGNWRELAGALLLATGEHRDAVLWILPRMPHLDRLEMSRAVLLEHVSCALASRHAFKYPVPDAQFRESILTYRISQEPVTPWRRFLFERFAPMARSEESTDAVARRVNGWCAEHLKVVPREFFGPQMSPLEVLQAGCGTAGEVSLLATAILKALGIPSRRVYVTYLGEEEGGASWVEVYSSGRWVPMYPLTPQGFGDFSWPERSHSRNVTVAIAASAFDETQVTGSYSAVGRLRVSILESGVSKAGFEHFSVSVVQSGALRPLDDLSRGRSDAESKTDSAGSWTADLGEGRYVVEAGVRDSTGSAHVWMREIEVRPSEEVSVVIDLGSE